MYMYAYMYISIQQRAVVFVLLHALLRVLLLNLLGIIILSYYHTIMGNKREKDRQRQTKDRQRQTKERDRDNFFSLSPEKRLE